MTQLLQIGATNADCILSRSRGVSITRRLGKDENIQRYEDFDTGLRVFVDNKISSVSTNENSEEALKEVAKRAVEMAKIAPEDEYSLIASKELLQQFSIQEDINIDCYDAVEPSTDIIRDRASEVFSKIVEMGVPTERLSIASSTSNSAQAEEVHIYLKN